MKRSQIYQLSYLALLPAALTATDASAEYIFIEVQAQLASDALEVGATDFESVYEDFLPSLRSGGILELTYIYDINAPDSDAGGGRQIGLAAFEGAVDGLSFEGFVDEAGVLQISQWSDEENNVNLIGGYNPAEGVPSLTDVLATMSFKVSRTEVIPDFDSTEVDVFEEQLDTNVWEAIEDSAIESGMGALTFVEVTTGGPAMRTYRFNIEGMYAFSVQKGDLNADGVVDGEDVAIALAPMSRTTFALMDSNDNGEIDAGDWNVLFMNWTQSTSTIEETHAPSKDDPLLPEDE